MRHRTRRPRRWQSVLLALAGVAVATWFVTVVPRDTSVEAPFEVEGAVGETVDLEFGTVTVTDVRLADAVAPASFGDGALAGGVFVVVDAVWEVRDRYTHVGGAVLIDEQDREHRSTQRGGCQTSGGVPPAYAQHMTYCFDVTEETLEGARLRFGRGGDEGGGSFQRRDAVAVVPVGLDADAPRDGTEQAPLSIEDPAPAAAREEDA